MEISAVGGGELQEASFSSEESCSGGKTDSNMLSVELQRRDVGMERVGLQRMCPGWHRPPNAASHCGHVGHPAHKATAQKPGRTATSSMTAWSFKRAVAATRVRPPFTQTYSRSGAEWQEVEMRCECCGTDESWLVGSIACNFMPTLILSKCGIEGF